jgi:Asp-tRNA(Asn)/Glu-tRNA(Gln) amidotransferase A subunit family amidase
MLKVNKNVLYEEGNELFGIPITIKDMFQMQGFDSTFGVASRFPNY